jgi:aryl-alcohol dehydrogenase-like predicted oxidoreductase
MTDLGHAALGAWSGGRFLHYGVALDDDRLVPLLRPDTQIRSVVTADVYGEGEADRLVGRAIAGLERASYRLVGALGHDFVDGERDGPRGYPRFTDPRLRAPGSYAAYLRRAAEASLARCGVDRFDLLLLHNPDRIGYTSSEVWEAMAALRDEGLADSIGIAPGPANGFTLDVIACLERFGSLIDWAMLILNPFEPWPARLALPACAAHDVRVLARVVDYGGLFHDALFDESVLVKPDHRLFRPAGWVVAGRERLDLVRPIAERHDLTLLQLACQWTLAQPAVACVVPTLIQEPGGRAIEDKRAELLATPADVTLTADEVAEIRAIGDNTGSMALKGAGPDHEGDQRPDRWAMDAQLDEVARRWGIEPERDLRQLSAARG